MEPQTLGVLLLALLVVAAELQSYSRRRHREEVEQKTIARRKV